LSLELVAFVTVVGLLWGLTALWLLLRAFRARPDKQAASGRLAGDAWVCRQCRSINRSRAARCYSCAADASLGVPVGKLARTAVPVMAPRAAGAIPVVVDGPTRPKAPVAVGSGAHDGGSRARSASGGASSARQPSDAATPLPPAVAASYGSTGDTGHPTWRRATRTPEATATEPTALLPAASPAYEGVDRPARPGAPTRQPAGAPASPEPRAALVCPYLGLHDDRTTRYDFPHPGNACYALGHRGPASGWRQRVAFPGSKGRPRQVSADEQAKLCLTPLHEQCPRFPVPTGVAKRG